MSKSIVYERDLLYPTDNLFEPGSIHVEILSPDKKGRMPVVIENKTIHSPVNYINSILGIMQSDIFDRIHINLKVNADLYIKANEEIIQAYGECKYLQVQFVNDKIEYFGINQIEA